MNEALILHANIRTRPSIRLNSLIGGDGDVFIDGFGTFQSSSRRRLLKHVIISIAANSGIEIFPFSSKVTRAAEAGLMSPYDIAELLKSIPTFTIVDEKGVPYTVFGEDAKVTGYFFTSYPECARILRLAKASANKVIAEAKKDGESSLEEIGTNPWNQARISTVPLDYAVTLVIKSNRMKGLYFKIAPAEEDVKTALLLTGDEDLSEGKVPLFYFEDYTIDAKENDGTRKTPLYFRKEELEKDWRQLNPRKETPKVLVTELFSVLSELVKPGGTDNELRNLLFVPPRESVKKSMECLKKGGNEPSFVVGKNIIVL